MVRWGVRVAGTPPVEAIMGEMSVLLNKLEILGLEMIGSFDPLTFC